MRRTGSLWPCASVVPCGDKQNSREGKGRAVRFLLKAAFWLTIVVMFLPAGESTPSAPQVGASEAISAASAAVSDARQFCSRQPDACAVGSQAATVLGQKAQNGAKMLYEFLSDRLAPDETGSVSAENADRSAGAPSSQHTLTPADQAPVWRGPEPRKDAHAKRQT
jgi:Family of unknown function (DUF5330)